MLPKARDIKQLGWSRVDIMIAALACFLSLPGIAAPFELKEIGSCLSERPLIFRADKPGYGYPDQKTAWFFDENGKKQKESFPIQNYYAAFTLDEHGSFIEEGGTYKIGVATIVHGNIFRRAGYRWVLDQLGSSYMSPDGDGMQGIGISTDSKTIAFMSRAPKMPLVWVSEQTKSGDYFAVRQVIPLVRDVGTATLTQFNDLTFVSPTIALFVGQIAAPVSEVTVYDWAKTLPDLREYKLSSSKFHLGRESECLLFGIDTSNGLTRGFARINFELPGEHGSGSFGAGTLISSSDNKWVFLKAGSKVLRLSTASILKYLEWEDK